MLHGWAGRCWWGNLIVIIILVIVRFSLGPLRSLGGLRRGVTGRLTLLLIGKAFLTPWSDNGRFVGWRNFLGFWLFFLFSFFNLWLFLRFLLWLFFRNLPHALSLLGLLLIAAGCLSLLSLCVFLEQKFVLPLVGLSRLCFPPAVLHKRTSIKKDKIDYIFLYILHH